MTVELTKLELAKLTSILTQLKSAARITVEDHGGEHDLVIDRIDCVYDDTYHDIVSGQYCDSDGNSNFTTVDEGRLADAELDGDGFIIVDVWGGKLTWRMYSSDSKVIVPKQDW